MTIYDCDDYTQAYYKKDCNVNVERNLLHEKTKPENLLVKPPPHTITSVGKEEDSIQNCLHLQPKAPKRNLKKLLDFAGKVCNNMVTVAEFHREAGEIQYTFAPQ